MIDSPQQLPLTFSSHLNQSLFSDHYLDEILRRSDNWRQAIPQAQPFLAWLRNLYAQEKEQLAHYNEDQLEDKWFKPIFAQLGYEHWEGQAVIPGWQGSIKKPDFFFFPDAAARHTAVSQQNTAAYAQSALAVCEVKQWGVNLSKKTGSQPIFADQNPMYQIDTYLSLTGLTWGVLSNGRRWRLLHKSSSRTLETYFEVDLLAALEQPDETKATAVAAYFWLFFRQAALRPDGDGRIFLDDALAQSRDYAIALEADLRDNAYRALEQLIIGFFAGDGRLESANPAHRAQVYQNSLYLLYRLLFIFYGESRALLPVAQPLYQEQYALQQLARQIDQRRSSLNGLPTTGKSYWNRLRELFRLISGIDPQLNADLGVPRYNGGLFDPAQHPFLEQHFVGDRALALAIDYLATRRIIVAGGKPEYQRVDYRTLDVRQLGSIYEGLLEYRVAVATEEMVTISQKGVETWLPLAQRGKAKSYGDRRQPGELYLTTDKGERKATGSYYTPDYIVEYIVAHTLGPLVEQARAAAGSEAGQKQRADRFIAEILRLNVLDPAMGSGHFLVEATNYLARVLATDEYVQVVGSGQPFRSGRFLTEPGGGGAVGTPAAAGDDDLLYWKRRVVEACIYGVDKNPMAVELAKLSLWLKTAAADKPLSFLDHHLQCGDSLIGAWLADLERPPMPTKPDRSLETCQVSFTLDLGLAVKGVATIERLPTLDIETVHAKEAAWRSIQQTHMARWRRLADLWVSAFFGNQMSAAEYRALAERLQGRESLLSEEQAAHFLDHTAVTDNDYFHWELAFPEVFFDEYGHPLGEAAGFDAVIGNPPYVRQEQMAAIKPFLPHAYQPVYRGTADLYVYFLFGGLRWLRSGGLLSYIVNNKWLRAGYGDGLRGYLADKALVKGIVDFGHAPIFADADTFPCILVLQKPENQDVDADRQTAICIFPREELDKVDITHFISGNSFYVSSKRFNNEPWSLERPEVDALMRKISRLRTPLTEFVGNKPYRGVVTGFNEAFLIDTQTRESLIKKHPRSEEIIKPYLRGQDIKRWFSSWPDLWMIFTRRGTDINSYPAIKEHLSQFRKQLEAKPNDWPEEAWPGRKPGTYEWYEIQDSIAYWDLFAQPKILYQEIQFHSRFALDTEGLFSNNKVFILPTTDLYLLGVLNSPLMWWHNWRYLPHMKDEALSPKGELMELLPIAQPTDAIRGGVETAVTQVMALTKEVRSLHKEMLDWLQIEFGIAEAGQKLESFAALNSVDFVQEVKKRRARSAGLLTPGEVRQLKTTHAQYGGDIRQLQTTMNRLENDISDLVNQAYGLTAEEVAWLWQTAPPRMPIHPPGQT